MVKLVSKRAQQNYTSIIRVLLCLQVLTSPFPRYQPRCSDCRTILYKSSATSSQDSDGELKIVNNSRINNRNATTTIIVTDDANSSSDHHQQQQQDKTNERAYCDQLQLAGHFHEPTYCVDYQACPSISSKPSERIRLLSCGLRPDGSVKVCCPLSERSAEQLDASKRSDEDLSVAANSSSTRQPKPPSSLGTVIVSDQPELRETTNKKRPKFARNCGKVMDEDTLETNPAAESRIIGGQLARQNAWPWFALLMVQRRKSGRFLAECGATLISDSHVLTAAHCVLEQGKRTIRESRLQVRLSEFDMSKRGDGELDVGVSRVFPHPEFNPKTFKNDIALIKLDRRVST